MKVVASTAATAAVESHCHPAGRVSGGYALRRTPDAFASCSTPLLKCHTIGTLPCYRYLLLSFDDMRLGGGRCRNDDADCAEAEGADDGVTAVAAPSGRPRVAGATPVVAAAAPSDFPRAGLLAASMICTASCSPFFSASALARFPCLSLRVRLAPLLMSNSSIEVCNETEHHPKKRQ